MTSLTDTQVVTASGGLVELGYSQVTADNTVTAGANSILIGPLAIVCDGSPILVEAFWPRIDSPTNGEAYVVLELDGVSQNRIISSNSPASLSFAAEHHGAIRLTPSAGSHTVQLRAYAGTNSAVYRAAAASGMAPAFLRVSKIVTATQWPAVTTGTIICTSSTRPASPFEGQTIYETDTKRELRWSGTAWVSPDVASSPPMCIARRNAAQSVADNTFTAVSFDTEDADTDGMFSPTSSNITIQTAGVYLVKAYVGWASSVTSLLRAQIKVGTNVVESAWSDASTHAQSALGISTVRNLSVGNVVTFEVYQTGPATSKNTASDTQMAIVWMGKP